VSLLLGEDYRPLWTVARKRLESNGLTLSGTPIRLTDLTHDQRAAICGLLGVSAAGDGAVAVRLTDLEAILRRGAAQVGVLEMVENAGGPIVDRRKLRRLAATTTAASWERVAEHPTLDVRDELRSWVAAVRRKGPATRLAGSPSAGAELVETVLRVMGRLPSPAITLAEFATECAGDAHALDRDQPLGKLTASALAHLHTDPLSSDGGSAGSPASAWRQAWACEGVVCDDVSVSCLVLNLPMRADGGAIAGAIAAHAEIGEPIRLTLRQLGSPSLAIDAPRPVYVCENPSIVAHAGQLLGPRSSPLICADGQPDSAVGALLELLIAQGCELRYHGDFDWGGIRIGNLVSRRYGAIPWRFGVDDYRAAAASGGTRLPSPPLGLLADWDDQLVSEMSTTRIAVHEEQVMAHLMRDLVI
jgi:uncharacterized protein (TIGR02679 family)